MLYGIIAVFDPNSIFKRCRIGRLGCRLHAASRASSGQTVEYALTSRTLLSSSPMICPTAFRRTAGLWLETKPRLRSRRAEVPHGSFTGNITPSEKSSDNDKYGTGSLVTREGSAALERRRRRLYKLVCAHGPGKRPAGKRPPFGSDAVSQELDPGALCRARSDLLAGRDAGSAPDRPHRAHGDAMRGARQGGSRAGSIRAAPSDPTAVPRRNCARPRSRRCPPAMTRSAARRSIRA